MTDPVARAELLIRAPIADVFEAFADPAITARFWFSHGTARLTPGRSLEWTWAMYGFTTRVRVLAVEPNRLIRVDWDTDREPTQIEWRFSERKQGETWVEVENSGFQGDEASKRAAALNSTDGFVLVLAGAKIWLEHGIEPNFVLDRMPDARVEGWKDR